MSDLKKGILWGMLILLIILNIIFRVTYLSKIAGYVRKATGCFLVLHLLHSIC